MWLERALQVLPRIEDPVFEVFLLGKFAMELLAMGDPQGRRLVERIWDCTGGRPRRHREVIAYLSAGMSACYLGHHETSARLLGAGQQAVAARESEKLSMRLASAAALLAFCRGVWDGLDQTCEALSVQCVDYWPARADVEVVGGALAVARGYTDQARDRLTGVVEQLLAQEEYDVGAVAVKQLVRLELAQGRLEDAVAWASQFLAGLEAKGWWAPVTRMLPSAVEAMVEAEVPRFMEWWDTLDVVPTISALVDRAEIRSAQATLCGPRNCLEGLL